MKDAKADTASAPTPAAHTAEHGKLTPRCAVRAASAQADVLPPGWRATVAEHTDGRRIILTASVWEDGHQLANASTEVDRLARGFDALCRVSWVRLRETAQHIAAAKRRERIKALAASDGR